MSASPRFEKFKYTLEALNYVFLGIFGVEMIVKMIGLGLMGPRSYIKDPYNLFDASVVILGVVEILVSLKGMTALRMFRLARVLRTYKMTRNWKTLSNIIHSLLHVLPKISSMGILLALYMFISAIAGMQLVGDVIPHESR